MSGFHSVCGKCARVSCKQLPVCIHVKGSTQAQEVLWCKYGGMHVRAVGCNGSALAPGSSGKAYQSWIVSGGHRFCARALVCLGLCPSDGCLMAVTPPEWRIRPQGLEPRTDCHHHHSTRRKPRTCRQDCDPGVWKGLAWGSVSCFQLVSWIRSTLPGCVFQHFSEKLRRRPEFKRQYENGSGRIGCKIVCTCKSLSAPQSSPLFYCRFVTAGLFGIYLRAGKWLKVEF